jgi:hypothetical protein
MSPGMITRPIWKCPCIKLFITYFRHLDNTTSQVTWIVNIIGVELGNLHLKIRVILMVFNATFNNISVISWWSILLVQETGVPGGNHRPAANNWQTLSHNVVFEYISSWSGFELITLVLVIIPRPPIWVQGWLPGQYGNAHVLNYLLHTSDI